MRAVPYKSALQGVPAPNQYSFYSLYPPYASLPAMASAQKTPARPAAPTQAAGWTDRGCPDLHDFEQPRVDSLCRLLELPSPAATTRPGPGPQWCPVRHIGYVGVGCAGRPGTGHWLGGGPPKRTQHQDACWPGAASLPPAVHPRFRVATPFGG